MTNEPKPPAIPSVSEDGMVNSNGLDLGCLNGWVSSEDPYESPIVKNPTDGFGNKLGEKKR